jgi:hypothetical protein
VTLRAEGPCANTFAQGNPSGPGSLTKIDKTLLPIAPGEHYELFVGSDFGPAGKMMERHDLGHHFEGTCPMMLVKWPAPPAVPVWPPTPDMLALHGLGYLTYNLHRLGVAEEVQYECLTPLVGPPCRLETPIYDWSVPYNAWPWWTSYAPGSTYSHPRMRLMLGIE